MPHCNQCDSDVTYPNSLNLCEQCFDKACSAYIGILGNAIEEWVASNPAPQRFCPYCNDRIPAVMVNIKPFNSYGNGCENCFHELTAQMNKRVTERHKQKKNQKPIGLVYFATNGTRIKVGKSRNITKRMEVLGIDLIHSLEIRDYTAAEMFFHERFNGYQIIGEWFDLPQELIEWITGLCTDGTTITDANGIKIWSAE